MEQEISPMDLTQISESDEHLIQTTGLTVTKDNYPEIFKQLSDAAKANGEDVDEDGSFLFSNNKHLTN